MKITDVVHGRVKVNVDSVLHIHNHPQFQVFEFDLESKYPGMVGYFIGGNTVEVLIGAGERTLHTRDTDQDTRITFTADGDISGWTVVANAARYTLRVVMYNNGYPEDAHG